jgi:hypothetical protein
MSGTALGTTHASLTMLPFVLRGFLISSHSEISRGQLDEFGVFVSMGSRPSAKTSHGVLTLDSLRSATLKVLVACLPSAAR